VAAEWRHNPAEQRWEWGVVKAPDLTRDDPGGQWTWHGFITDEFIASYSADTAMAVRMYGRFGSVPPPFAALLPPDDDRIIYGGAHHHG
jgi:hypothetical protein